MEKPCLVIMAGGMGSRYGGLKQVEPVDAYGHTLMDFSLYDARRAGFERVVFIIRRDMEAEFKKRVADRAARHMDVEIAFQDLSDIPAGFCIPEGRTKPWGTAHALYSARHAVKCSFVAINADDYYGVQAFKDQYGALQKNNAEGVPMSFSMSGYNLENTVSLNGSVSRGICTMDSDNMLTGIRECTRIEVVDGRPSYTPDDGKTWTAFPKDTIVSMNMWGFTRGFLDVIGDGLAAFLKKGLEMTPLKCEYYIPSVVEAMLDEKKAVVNVIPTADRWYGITYKEDRKGVVDAMTRMQEAGIYPEDF